MLNKPQGYNECATCGQQMHQDAYIQCYDCERYTHNEPNCSIEIDILTGYLEIYKEIYEEIITQHYMDYARHSESYPRNFLYLCIPCNVAHLNAFFEKVPHHDLPKYINFPWENIGGNVIYKRMLAGLPAVTSEGVPT